jgi:hypothetical protein
VLIQLAVHCHFFTGKAGEVCAGDSVELLRLVWAEVHDISMLRLAHDLSPNGIGRRFVELSCEILEAGMKAQFSSVLL